MTAMAQEADRTELKRRLQAETNDSLKVAHLLSLGISYEKTDTSQAFHYYCEGLALAQRMKHCELESSVYNSMGVAYMNSSRYHLADEFCRRSLSVARRCGNKQRIAKALANIGITFDNRNMPDSAVYYMITALEVFESYGALLPAAICCNHLSYYYSQLHMLQKAIDYGKLSVKYGRQFNHITTLATAYINIARGYLNMGAPEKCMVYCDSAAGFVSNFPILYDKAASFQNLASMTYSAGGLESANAYADSCIFWAENLGNPKVALACYSIKGQILVDMNKLDEADVYFDKALAPALANREWRQLRDIYQGKADAAYQRGDFKSAYDFLDRFAAYRDSTYNEDVVKASADVTEKYETEKREAELRRVIEESELRNINALQQNRLKYLFMGIAVLAMITAILLYMNSRRRSLIAQQQESLQIQKIRELENEKQMGAMDAIIKAEENERSRVAKDLHDGLGSLLSGVKLSLSSMKGNVIISEEHARIFGNSIEQLDHAIQEMRRVAHNMMPESLVKFGLIQAIRNFGDGLNESGLVQVHLEHHDFSERLSSDQEIMLYRIVQELVNNAIRHGESTHIIIQLSRHTNHVHLVVEDDGKGFEVADLTSSSGAGYTNLRHRVNYLKGTIDIRSDKNKGTSVLIEFPVA